VMLLLGGRCVRPDAYQSRAHSGVDRWSRASRCASEREMTDAYVALTSPSRDRSSTCRRMAQILGEFGGGRAATNAAPLLSTQCIGGRFVVVVFCSVCVVSYPAGAKRSRPAARAALATPPRRLEMIEIE
jgi:hypothetical protein